MPRQAHRGLHDRGEVFVSGWRIARRVEARNSYNPAYRFSSAVKGRNGGSIGLLLTSWPTNHLIKSKQALKSDHMTKLNPSRSLRFVWSACCHVCWCLLLWCFVGDDLRYKGLAYLYDREWQGCSGATGRLSRHSKTTRRSDNDFPRFSDGVS